MIIGAIAFFCYTMSYHFESRWVNLLAVSTLSIYLMQTKCFSVYCVKLMSPFGTGCAIHSDWMLILVKFAVMIVGVLAFSAMCIALDRLRILIVTPIINKVKQIEKG